MGSVTARKSSAVTLPIPLRLPCGTLNLTVLEDEFRMPAIGQFETFDP
jgi:hypothetical protein